MPRRGAHHSSPAPALLPPLLQRRSGNDSCPEPLFSSVNREHPFWKSPVTVAFVALLDNYERELSEKEDYTAQEKREVTLRPVART